MILFKIILFYVGSKANIPVLGIISPPSKMDRAMLHYCSVSIRKNKVLISESRYYS
jgi:hypothetical protein